MSSLPEKLKKIFENQSKKIDYQLRNNQISYWARQLRKICKTKKINGHTEAQLSFVLTGLIDSSPNGEITTIGQGNLAKKLRVSRKTVNKYIGMLASLGVIHKKYRYKKNKDGKTWRTTCLIIIKTGATNFYKSFRNAISSVSNFRSQQLNTYYSNLHEPTKTTPKQRVFFDQNTGEIIDKPPNEEQYLWMVV